MDSILQDLLPSNIALAIDANKIAYGALLSTLPEAEFHDDPGLCWFETGVALDLFNGVLQTRLEVDALPAASEGVLAHFQRRHLPFQWHVGPSSQPGNCGHFLQARGIMHVEDEPGMAVDLYTLNEDITVSTRVAIHLVTTDEMLHQWARIWGCGAPDEVTHMLFIVFAALHAGADSSLPLRFYLGTLDGEPVATVALFFGAGVAAIEHVVTLPEIRGQGIGAAMTLKAAQEARREGYRIGILTASPMGINIYRRLGFREYCTFSTYAWDPSSQGSSE